MVGELHAEQGERSEDEDQLRGGAVRHVPVLPSKEEEVQEETEKVLQGNCFAILAAERRVTQRIVTARDSP